MAKKLDISKLAARLTELNENQGGQGSGSVTFLNIKDGRNVIRILPPREDMESFGEEVWVHYGVGKTDSNRKGTMVVCPKTHGEDKPCPVCEASKELMDLSSKKDDSYSKQAKALYRKKRVYYNAISREDNLDDFEQREEDGKQVWYNKVSGEKETPIKVLGTGIGIYKDIIGLIIDPEYGDVTDAEEGLDLIVTRSGSGQFNTEYKVSTVRKETPIGMDNWEENLNDLKGFKAAKSYDDLAKMLLGESPSDSSNENKDEDEKGDEPVDTSSDSSSSDGDLQDEIAKALAERRNKK